MAMKVLSWVDSIVQKEYPINPKIKDNAINRNFWAFRLGLTTLLSNEIVVENPYTIVLFKIGDKESVIYSILYLHNDIPEFVCLSYSLVSMDGEYRSRFVPYKRWEMAYSCAAVDYLENNMKTIPPLHTVVLGPNSDKIEKYISKSRLPYQFYISSWLIYNFYKKINLIENHINPKYDNIIIQQNKFLYIKLLENIGRSEVEKTIIALTLISLSSALQFSKLILGQKLTPIKHLEYLNWGNIKYNVWKELYCNNVVGDLLINNISPHVSFPTGYFVVKMNKELFDNDSMRNKMHQSDTIKKTLAKVQNITKSISIHDTLKRAFDNPLEIAQKNIIMSDYAVCYVSEYVGRTMADMPILTNHSFYKIFIGQFFVDYALYKRYMFDILYALLSINHVGIIHGDLHLNNCTLYSYISIYDTNGKLVGDNINKLIAYEIDDKIYTFNHRGGVACIIDFSRAVLHPDLHKKADTDNILLDGMKKDILHGFEYYFPKEFPDIKHSVEISILQNKDWAYRCYTAFDAYVFSYKMSLMLDTSDIQINDKCVQFNNNLLRLSKQYLFQLIDVDINYGKSEDNFPTMFDSLPIQQIIHELFEDHEYPNIPDGKIIEHYKLNTGKNFNIKYSMSTFKSRPEYLKSIKGINADGSEEVYKTEEQVKEKFNYKNKFKSNITQVLSDIQ